MGERPNPPVLGVFLLACAGVAGVCIGGVLFWWLVVVGWTGLLAGLVIVLSLLAAAAVLVYLLVEGLRVLRGRGEDHDVMDEATRARIDGDGEAYASDPVDLAFDSNPRNTPVGADFAEWESECADLRRWAKKLGGKR